MQALEEGKLDPKDLFGPLVILLKKLPFSIPPQLSKFMQKEGSIDSIIQFMALMEKQNFENEPIANSSYQIALAKKIVGLIEKSLFTK